MASFNHDGPLLHQHGRVLLKYTKKIPKKKNVYQPPSFVVYGLARRTGVEKKEKIVTNRYIIQHNAFKKRFYLIR